MIHLYFTVFLSLCLDRSVSMRRSIFAVLLTGVCAANWLSDISVWSCFVPAFISSKGVPFCKFHKFFYVSLLSSPFYWLASHLSLVLSVLMYFSPCLKVCIQILSGLYFGRCFRRGRWGFFINLKRCRYEFVFPWPVNIAVKFCVRCMFMFSFSWWWAHRRPKHIHKKKHGAPNWLYLQDHTGM